MKVVLTDHWNDMSTDDEYEEETIAKTFEMDDEDTENNVDQTRFLVDEDCAGTLLTMQWCPTAGLIC